MKRPKGLPGYVSDEMYEKYQKLFDAALEADQVNPHYERPLTKHVTPKQLEAFKKAFKKWKS